MATLSTLCVVAALTVALNAGAVGATARLGASATFITAPGGAATFETTTKSNGNHNHEFDMGTFEVSAAAATERILATASASLSDTYALLDAESRTFPDVVDARTGKWHFDDVTANGAAGLLAGCLWSMYQLTGLEAWRTRALAASATIRSAVGDASIGQALGTLAYPALRHAYEQETDADERAAYLSASLDVADGLAKLYARIPSVLKARPTADVAREARAAGAAAVSPLAVFSTPDGSAAAMGLLAWAAGLPGGQPSWSDMAVGNARRIATDHVRADGSVAGTLVYKATSARAAPSELADLGLPPASAVALEAWLGSVGGHAPSPMLRQAMTALSLAEAGVAAAGHSDADVLMTAAERAAQPLVDASADPLMMEPAAAAAAAAAFATLSEASGTPGARETYAAAAQRVLAALASDRLSHAASGAGAGSGVAAAASELVAEAEHVAAAAGRWVVALLGGSSEVARPAEAGSDSAIAAKTTSAPSSILIRSGSRSGDNNADGQGGSMLADYMLLTALVKTMGGGAVAAPTS